MAKGIVSSVSTSKTGKSWRVKIGDKFYGAKFDSKIDGSMGKPIDFLVQSDAKFGDWIESWVYDESKPRPLPPIPPPNVPAQPPLTADRWWLPFCSNQVAHAIAAGLIKEPGQIKPWAEAAYRAVTSVGQWTPQQTDDGVDF